MKEKENKFIKMKQDKRTIRRTIAELLQAATAVVIPEKQRIPAITVTVGFFKESYTIYFLL